MFYTPSHCRGRRLKKDLLYAACISTSVTMEGGPPHRTPDVRHDLETDEVDEDRDHNYEHEEQVE